MNPLNELIRRDLEAALPIGDALEILEMMVREKVTLNDEGNIVVEWANLDGSPASIADYVAQLKRDKPTLFQNTAAPVIPDFVAAWRDAGNSKPANSPATGSMTEQALAYNAYAKSPEGKAARAKKVAADAVAAGNPFAKATYNLTKQMALSKSDPALAQRLRQEAGQ